MTASRDMMERLHKKVAETLIREMDGEYLSANLIGAAINFLKNNNISVPADNNNTLKELQERIRDRKKAANVINLADHPLTNQEKEELKTRSG